MDFEKIKDYEDRTKKIADEKGINAEDIIRADAGRENYDRQDYGRERFPIERVANSDLTYEYPDKERMDLVILKGNIDGKNIEIQANLESSGRNWTKVNIEKSFIDGGPLAVEDAEKIFNEYKRVASNRNNYIDQIKYDKEKKEEDEKKLSGVRDKISAL